MEISHIFVVCLIIFIFLVFVFLTDRRQTYKSDEVAEYKTNNTSGSQDEENVVDWNGVKVKLKVPKLDTKTLNKAFHIIDAIQPRVITGNQGGLSQLYYDQIRADLLNQILDFYIHKGRFPAGDICCNTSFLNASRIKLYHIPDFVANRDSNHYFPNLQPINLSDPKVREKIDLFKPQIDQFLKEWRKYIPDRRYPGGGGLPPRGYLVLKRYIETHIYNTGEFPKGIHYIPAGADVFQTTSDSFGVKFPEEFAAIQGDDKNGQN